MSSEPWGELNTAPPLAGRQNICDQLSLQGDYTPWGTAEQKKKVGEEGDFVPTRSELSTGFANILAVPGTAIS